jgi:hypothetical protein
VDVIDTGERPSRQWAGAACGIAAVGAILAGAFIVAPAPDANAPTEKILGHYIEHRRSLLFAQWLTGLGAALFLAFVGCLRGKWARSESTAQLSAVAFAGGVALGTGMLIATGVNVTLAYLAREIQNTTDLVRTLYTAHFLLLTVLCFAGAVFLAGSGLLLRRLGFRWRGFLGVLLAVYSLFAAAAISAFDGVRSPTGPLTMIAFGGLLAWVLLASLALLARRAPSHDPE